jgi:hypothetical protein
MQKAHQAKVAEKMLLWKAWNNVHEKKLPAARQLAPRWGMMYVNVTDASRARHGHVHGSHTYFRVHVTGTHHPKRGVLRFSSSSTTRVRSSRQEHSRAFPKKPSKWNRTLDPAPCGDAFVIG